MSADFEERKKHSRMLLKNILDAQRDGSAKSFILTEAAKAKAVIGWECTLTLEEVQAEADSMSREDYEEKNVINALEKRFDGRIDLDAEHPTAKVFRCGIESIRTGKPSEIFLQLLELIADSADSVTSDDVLAAVAGFKKILPKTMRAAKRDKRIADEFKKSVKEGDAAGIEFSEIKCQKYHGFMKQQADKGNDKKTVERALVKYGMSFPAKTNQTTKQNTINSKITP